jgi:hypothetical protein
MRDTLAADFGDVIVELLPPLRRHHLRRGSVEDFLSGVTQDASSRFIDGEHVAIEIVGADQITTVFDQVAVGVQRCRSY